MSWLRGLELPRINYQERGPCPWLDETQCMDMRRELRRGCNHCFELVCDREERGVNLRGV